MAGIEDILGSVLGGSKAKGNPQSGGAGGMNMQKLLPLLLPLIMMMMNKNKGSSGGQGGGGLGDLLGKLNGGGLGGAVNSWTGTGENEPVDPAALEAALGPDTIDDLAQQSGMTPEEVRDSLSQVLPEMVNGLSPDGQLPTGEALDSALSQFEQTAQAAAAQLGPQ